MRNAAIMLVKAASAPTLAAFLQATTITGNGDNLTSDPGSATFELDPDGYAYESRNTDADPAAYERNQLFQWKTGGGVAGDYEAYVTIVSGSLTTGTTGTGLALSSLRTWTRTRSINGTATCVIAVTIRPAGGGTALDSDNITLTATA